MARKYVGDRISFFARVALLVLNGIALGFLSAALSLQRYVYTDGTGSMFDALILIPIGFSLVWTTVAFTINSCGISHHPGIDIALEFCGFGLAVSWASILIAWIVPYGIYEMSNCYSYRGRECTQLKLRVLNASEMIAAITVMTSGLIHFMLFVKGCRDVHVRLARQKRRYHEVNDK